MELLVVLEQLRRQLLRQKLRQEALVAALLVGIALAVVLLTALFYDPALWPSVIITTALLLLIGWRRGWFYPVSLSTAALELDERLQLKERTLSYLSLKNRSAGSPGEEEQLLAIQIQNTLKQTPPERLTDMAPLPQQLQRLKPALPILWIAVLALALFLWYPTGGRDPVQLLQQLLQTEAELPPQLRESLQQLAQVLESAAPPADIQGALQRAEAELKATQDRLTEESTQLTDTVPRDYEHQVTDTPPPAELPPSPLPPTPSPAAPEQPQDKSDAATAEKQPQTGQEESEQGGDQGDSRQSKDDKQQSADGDSGGDSSDQSGTGQEQQADDGSGDNQGEGQGEGSQAEQDGAGNGAQDQSGPEQGTGAEAGENRQQEQLNRVQQTLDQVKDALESQDPAAQQEQTAESGRGKEQEADEGSAAEKGESSQQTEAGEETSPDSEPETSPTTGAPEGAGEERSMTPPPDAESPEGQKAAPGEAGDSKLWQAQDEAPREADFGGEEKFAEVELPAASEEFDARFTDTEVEVVRGREGSEYRLDLKELELAKPAVSREQQRQPIPLEYRDMLK